MITKQLTEKGQRRSSEVEMHRGEATSQFVAFGHTRGNGFQEWLERFDSVRSIDRRISELKLTEMAE